MAAVKRGTKKSHLQRKKIKKPRWSVAKPRKLTSYRRKNAGAIKSRKRSSLRRRPLVSSTLKRGIRNRVLSSRKHKCPKHYCSGYHSKTSYQMSKQKMPPHMACSCSMFLQALLAEMASRKCAKWVMAAPRRTRRVVAAPRRTRRVVAAPKRRMRYSDNEIFYRLADAMDRDVSGIDAETNTSTDSVPGPEALSQPAANEPQAVTTS